jgi:hypothetical protein
MAAKATRRFMHHQGSFGKWHIAPICPPNIRAVGALWGRCKGWNLSPDTLSKGNAYLMHDTKVAEI